MNPRDLCNSATGYTSKLAADYLAAVDKIAELEAVIAAFSRPVAFPPVAEVPVRVLSVEIPEDAE
jgi:hypothetical protein